MSTVVLGNSDTGAPVNRIEHSAVDTSVNSSTVTARPCSVVAVYVNTVLSAHTVVLKDDTTAVFTLPASLAAGTMIDLHGANFDTSLVVDPDDSSTGNITILYIRK